MREGNVPVTWGPRISVNRYGVSIADSVVTLVFTNILFIFSQVLFPFFFSRPRK